MKFGGGGIDVARIVIARFIVRSTTAGYLCMLINVTYGSDCFDKASRLQTLRRWNLFFNSDTIYFMQSDLHASTSLAPTIRRVLVLIGRVIPFVHLPASLPSFPLTFFSKKLP